MKCEHCLPQLLPFVYDLLEPDERADVAAHLEGCVSCSEAMKSAREHAGLLAEAVKDRTGGIVFQAPPEHAVTASAPTVAMARPRRPLFLINRWSIAATLLLAFFSVGGVIGWNIWRENAGQLEQAQERLAKATADRDNSKRDSEKQKVQTQEEIRAIQAQINQLFNDWRTEENKKRKLEQDRVQFFLKGPEVAQAGANNRYEVQVLQQDAADAFNNRQAPGLPNAQRTQQRVPSQKVEARVVNKKTQEMLFQQNLTTDFDGNATFILPSDIPCKPGDDIVLLFETRSPEGKLVKLGESLKLVFPEYLTHLATDRPLYRPGETVRFRSLTLERFSLKPAQQSLHLRYRIVGPNGAEVFKQDVASERLADAKKTSLRGPRGAELHGVGAGECPLPADLPTGRYTLCCSEVNDRFQEEKRTFTVHQRQVSRLEKEVQFDRSSYGAGDRVRVQLKVIPLQGLAPAGNKNSNVQVSAKAYVDDQEILLNNQPNNFTDETGVIAFTFTLPGQIGKGIGSVAFMCEDAGNKETVRRAIPIAVNNLELDFYPEGGDLIAGVPNRVYFQARTPANRPADVEATILDEKRQIVARIKTVTDDQEPGINQGLGSFVFTPRFKGRYFARIDSPIGIGRDYALPPVKDKGLVMTIPQGVVEDEIGVSLQSAKEPRELLVGAYCRGRMLDHKFVQAGADQATEVTLKPQAAIGGVYRVTVFEKLTVAGNLVYRPLAERLIYRKNAAKVEVLVEADKPGYQPGDAVSLSLRAVNEKKEFVPAFAMIAVVDQSVLKLADEKTARTMPTHFLLTTEVRNPEDLENADVLLGTHPKAALALDLLLGSQGWRRFAEQDPELFQRRLQQTKPPVFLQNGNPVFHSLDAEQQQIDKLDQHFVSKAIDLEKTLAQKEQQEVELPQRQDQVRILESTVNLAAQTRAQADERLRDLSTFYVQFAMGGALLTLLFIGFFLISVGLRRLAEGDPARSWLVIGIALLGILFFASVVGTFVFIIGEHLLDNPRFSGRGGPFPPPVQQMPAQVMQAPMGPMAMPVSAEDGRDYSLEMEPESRPAEAKVAMRKKAPPPVQQNFGNDLAVNNLNFNNQLFNQNKDWPNNGAANPDFRNNQERSAAGNKSNYQTRAAESELGRRVQMPAVEDPCVVREYAHQHKPRKDDVRRDFAETLYWHPVLVMPDGKASVKFDLSDAVTRFQVLVFSHTADGRLGANRIEIESKLPFSVDPKTPIEVTNTDKITVPVALGNRRPERTEATLSARTKGLTLEEIPIAASSLVRIQNKRELYQAAAEHRRRDCRDSSRGPDQECQGRGRTPLQGRPGRLPDHPLGQRRARERHSRAHDRVARELASWLVAGASDVLSVAGRRVAERPGGDGARAGRLLRAKRF